MPMPKKERRECLNCGKDVARPTYKYCSNPCQLEFQYRIYIKRWKAGQVKGLQGLGIVSGYIKRYLRYKFNNKCCLCGWSKINSKTRLVPLAADHIDGNWRNNTEDN